MKVLVETDQWTIRRASPADNAGLLALARDVPMAGAVRLSQERDPDFFAIQAVLDGPLDVYVAEDPADRIIACGSHHVRPVRLHGQPTKLGHVGDLRIRPEHRGGRLFSALAAAGFEDAQRHGTRWATSAVARNNRPAARSTARIGQAGARKATQPGNQPRTQRLVSYRFHSVQVHSKAPPPNVRHATKDDAGTLARFLDDAQGERELGRRWSTSDIHHRFATWPGMDPSDWLLLEDRTGGVRGCAAWWDPAPVKRVRVHRYGPIHRLQRRGWNAWATVRGLPALPSAGTILPMAYLTHFEAHDTEAARLLLDAGLARSRAAGHAVLGCLEPMAGPLHGLARGRLASTMNVDLLGVSRVDEPRAWDDVDAWHPGIEAALA